MKGDARIAPVGTTERQRDITDNVPVRPEREVSLERHPLEASEPSIGDIGPPLDPDDVQVVAGDSVVLGSGASAGADVAISREVGGAPRDIGAFADPDAAGTRELGGKPRDVGAFADPDAAISREVGGERRDIGAFADPDVAVSPDSGGEPSDTGDFLEPDG